MKDYMEEMVHILKMRAAQIKVNGGNQHELALIEARIAELT